MNTKHTFALNLIFLSLTSHLAPGALFYNSLVTDSSGTFVNAGTGWSGTTFATGGGVVGPAGYGTGASSTMINDFTGSGTLSLGPVTGFGPPILTPTTGTMSVTLGGGGSGDIVVNLHQATKSPHFGRPVGFNVTDLQGVSSVTVEINFSEPLAANWRTGGAIGRTDGPFLAGFRTQPGTESPWNFSADYLGIRHTTAVGGPFIAGLPAGLTAADSVDMSLNSFNWGSGSSFSGTSSNTSWQGVNLFDIDSDSLYEQAINDSSLQDVEAVYATGMRFTFTPTSGSFLDGSNFLFSTNGGQYADTFADAQAFVPAVIPEPSAAFLLSLGLCSALCRRRRNE